VRSRLATVQVAHIDAFPQGFEFVIAATAHDPYGIWPVAGIRRLTFSGATGRWPGRDARRFPRKLLRVGVVFADGRIATHITGHDLPVDGPVVWPLGGGGRGRHGVGESHFQRGRHRSSAVILIEYD